MMKMFIKAADVSNETRPMDVAEPWLECLLQEFFQQVAFVYFACSIFHNNKDWLSGFAYPYYIIAVSVCVCVCVCLCVT